MEMALSIHLNGTSWINAIEFDLTRWYARESGVLSIYSERICHTIYQPRGYRRVDGGHPHSPLSFRGYFTGFYAVASSDNVGNTDWPMGHLHDVSSGVVETLEDESTLDHRCILQTPQQGATSDSFVRLRLGNSQW
jgi:hypothetical protein